MMKKSVCEICDEYIAGIRVATGTGFVHDFCFNECENGRKENMKGHIQKPNEIDKIIELVNCFKELKDIDPYRGHSDINRAKTKLAEKILAMVNRINEDEDLG